MTNFPKWQDARDDIVAGAGDDKAVAQARHRNQAYIDGHRLAERRKAPGLTQADVANLLLHPVAVAHFQHLSARSWHRCWPRRTRTWAPRRPAAFGTVERSAAAVVAAGPVIRAGLARWREAARLRSAAHGG